jgi:hypothetical protein
MIDGIFELVEAPARATGQVVPIFVDGVASPNWLPDASARMLHRVFRSMPDTDRSWHGTRFRQFTTRPTLKIDGRLKDAIFNMDLTVSLVTRCSVSRPRRQGFASPRTKRAPLTAPGIRRGTSDYERTG